MTLAWERKGPDILTAGGYTVTRFNVSGSRVFRAFCAGKALGRIALPTAKDAMRLCEDHARQQAQ